jgi:Caspase domain
MKTVFKRFTVSLGLTLLLAVPGGLGAQEDAGAVSLNGDLPRVLVFIQEEGGQIAATALTNFMLEAGFPVVDPALAFEAAQRELVRAALDGDEGAATNLGRDFGAQVLILGKADWGARPDPMDGSLIVATGELSVRALRLDLGRVVAVQQADGGRQLEVTEQRGKAMVLRRAASALLNETPFIGRVINGWEAEPWQEALYWVPDPGSVPSRVGQAGSDDPGVGLAILRADVAPSSGTATRGLGVVKKGDRSSALFNAVRLEGVVIGDASDVKVEGKPANLQPLEAGEAARLGLTGQPAQRFWAETNLPMSQDSVSIIARGVGGAVAEAVAAPRIDKRYAVVIGIGKYESEDIPDLEFARADAESVRDFLLSDLAGPFDDVLFLADEDATGAKMREALFVFLQQANWDDLVFIYYAGHGAPDPNRPDNLYLLPTDSDLDAMASTAFPMWDMKTALRRQIAAERVIVVADACHSAGTADGETVGGGDSNHIAGSFDKLFTPSRRLMMTAADTNEFSLEDARWSGHGVFTYFLLDALEGKGDLDGDGIVTFSEVFDYVSSNVVSATEGRQNPQRAGFGDIPLAIVPDSSDPGGG